jgi:hypothetical protein
MRISLVVPVWLLAVPLFVAALPAVAQSPSPPAPQAPPPTDSNINFGGMLEKKKPTPVAPAVAAPPMAWPRLDPGAVLCRSEDDLARRSAILRGEQAGPADCRPITTPTAIQIMHRAGPGRTEVQVTGRTETGWTDAWLPASPPPGTTPIQGGQLPGGRASSNR